MAHPAFPDLVLGVEAMPTDPCRVVIEPVFALVAQGAKRLQAGAQCVDYGRGQYIVVPVGIPADSQVTEASPRAPYLGVGLILRPEPIASLIHEAGEAPSREDVPTIGVDTLSPDLVDAVVRLLRILDRPTDLRVLGAALRREILWRLMTGPQGVRVRQLGFSDSRLARIAKATGWLREHFAETISVDDLASAAGMSPTTFHRHFRAATALTPIQYQKQLRLQAARLRLISGDDDIATVGFAVGYDSPSQFSREYRRLFGKAPLVDRNEARAGVV
ncbi:AraC family transcriptional regulator [Luteibacter sp. UNCMF331Sha3.1]|uniref:AraC family transcriptional regulator n=1 Tax=Luteibacter sp. UNCMF331Sha3.1 TaxID=1502760 RepID=UPI00244EF793|nr:AraC family transcriptional regulator [Luteibacter sp. UNCMF331Sha3.1]